MLGTIASQREGTEKDQAEAALWYQRAADSGFARAQARLAVCYATGSGVPQDDVEAVKWYRRAAAQGEIQSAVSLGYYYQSGQGVPQDYAESVRWYRVAAEGGDRLSQNILADSYTTGLGVAYSPSEAARWRRRAADQGDPEGQYGLARVYYEGAGVERDPATSYFWATLAIEHLSEEEARESAVRLLSTLGHELTESQKHEVSIRAAQWHATPGSTDTYESADGTLRAAVVVTQAGGESRVEIRDGSEILAVRHYSSPDGQHGFIVQRAEWTPDSRFFVFSLASSGGHQPWHSPTFFYSRRTNRFEALDPYSGPVGDADFQLSAPDAIRVMTVMPGDRSGALTEVHLRLGELPARKR